MVFTDTDYKLFTIGAKFKSKGFRALSEIIDMVEEKLNKKEVVNIRNMPKIIIFLHYRLKEILELLFKIYPNQKSS